MSIKYPISVLKTQRNNLEDKLTELDNGYFSKYPEEQVQRFKEEVVKYLKDINQGIKVLEEYIES